MTSAWSTTEATANSLTPPALFEPPRPLKSHGKSHERRLSIPGRDFATDGQVLHNELSINDKEWSMRAGFCLRRGSSCEFGQCVPKHQSQCALAFRGLQICFTAQGIGFGIVVLAVNQMQWTAVGSGRHLSGKMVGNPPLQVGGEADIEFIVLLTQEDVDAVFQFLGHPATLEKHSGPVPEILPPVGLRYRAHEPVPSADILTEMLQKFVEGLP
jgi:hypothetical protein